MPRRNNFDDDDIVLRVERLEERLSADEIDMKRLLDIYRASKIIGRILVILGGMTIGAVTIFTAIVTYFGKK